MKKLLLIAFFFSICCTQVWAQSRTVGGQVLDENAVPVVNATISIKGNKKATVTGTDGRFSLEIPSGATELEVSYVGKESKTIHLTQALNYFITLTNANNNMQEVVVVGYGTKTVRENTGAISKVAGSSVAKEPVSSLDQALAGKTAGVQIGMGTGVLADRTAIRVRGINSISSSSQPLIVVDGIPQITVDNLNGFNGGNGTRFDPLALIDPNDIESIEVLKDAGAASIYGSRASNGVILITTKRGKKGQIKVNAESKVGWSKASKLPSLLNSDQFTTIMNEKARNNPNASGIIVAKESDVNGDGQPDRTNWLDYDYRTAMTYDNYVSFSGGADKLSVFGSARYVRQEGITTGNRLTSGQTRLNLDFTPKSWFKSGIQLAYTRTVNNGVLTDGYISGTNVSGWQAPPNVSPFNPNGPLGYNLTTAGLLGNGNNVTSVGGGTILPSASYYYNILPTIQLGRNDNTADEVRGSIYGSIEPVKGLSLTTKFGIQNLSNFEDQYTSPHIGGLGAPFNGLVQDQQRNFRQWVWQNYLNFDRTFANQHKISFVAGTEYQENSKEALYTAASNFTDPFFNHIIDNAYTSTLPGSTDVMNLTGGDQSNSGLISYFSRLGYSYRNKYFVEGSIRRDGYSGFGTNNQFGTFPSVSLGWEATRERFLEGTKWLDYLKVRGSYGEVGNSRGVGDYASRTLFGGAAYTSINGLGITQAGNANLKWETAKKLDVGFDARVLHNRLNITADYFDNNINNLILAAPVQYTTGVPSASITTNIGGMKNKGFELTLSSTLIQSGDFTWSSSLNFTRIWNKVTGLVPSNQNADIVSGVNVASVGKALGTFYLPRWAGVDPNTGNPMWYAKDGTIKRYNLGATGNLVWTDQLNNPVKALTSSDYVYTDKSGLPNFYGGWDNTFAYRNVDLNVAVVYQGGNAIYNTTRSAMLTNYFSNNITDVLRRWQKPGDVTDIPKLFLLNNQANVASTRFLEKGDFIRIRTITLGYNFTRTALQHAGIDNIRVYAQAFNPFVFTKYSGLDPDVSTAGTVQNNLAVGIDNKGTPQAKTLTLGVSVNF
jgi:TonB-dependent starch-binding outer membrane protein SusC